MKQIKVNEELLEKVAKLAKIQLKEEEKQELLSDFANIIKEFEKLQEIDFPMKNSRIIFQQVVNQFSSNKKIEANKEAILEAFPHKKDGNPKVPPILGDSNE